MSDHWKLIESLCDKIDIYHGPDSFLASFQKVRPEIGFLYSAHFCRSEICNGGFTQFFSNSTGVLAPEAVSGFALIGQPKIAKIVQRAMDLLCLPYLRNREDRQKALTKMISIAGNRGSENDALAGYRNVIAFEPLEDEFYSLIDVEDGGFETAAGNYAMVLATSHRSLG
jgi:hypothetical protein